VNLVNGKVYVGSATFGRMYMRFYRHLISLKGSTILANAVKKYGLDSFVFALVETNPNFLTNNSLLLSRETYYISVLNSEYNIAKIGGNTQGVKHSNETKEKMKAGYTPERLKILKDKATGRLHTEETKEQMKKAATGRKHTQETKNKVSSNSANAHY
jgi:group I intron endonuclease